MTIQELIEKLEKYPRDFDVNIQNGDNGGDYPGSREVVGIENREEGVVIY